MTYPASWTPAQLEILRTHAGKLNSRQISEMVHHSAGATRVQMLKLGLPGWWKSKNAVEKWTPEKLERLRELMPTHNCRVIAKELEIGLRAVIYKAKQLGIFTIHRPKLNTWTAEEDAYLLSCGPQVRAREISQKLGRTVTGVYRRSQRLGRKCRSAEPLRRRRVAVMPKKPKKEDMVRVQPVYTCPTYHCPVSNRKQHYERLGCNCLPPYLREWNERRAAA